jgi:hypothetical protein
MAGYDRGERLLHRLVFMSLLDGIRASGIPQWLSPVAPVVTQAAVGAGHWAAGRRQRAVAAWVSAAGFGLVAWGLTVGAIAGEAWLAVFYAPRVPRAVRRRRPRLAAGSALVVAGALARLRAAVAEPLR